MKRFISALLATLFVLTAFGVTSIFAGFVGAGATSYDYYKYTSIPGFANFTDAELGLLWNQHVESGHNDTTLGVPNAVTWTVKAFNEWKCVDIYSGAPVNMKAGNHTNPDGGNTLPNGDMGDPSWSGLAALTTVGGKAVATATGKTIMGDNSMKGYDGISFYVAKNGQPYTGGLKISLIQVPSQGPYYNGRADNGDQAFADAIQETSKGFRYGTDTVNADSEGYFHFNFKTDFKNTDWWTKDDDGISRSIYGDADGDGIKNGDNYFWAIPKSKIAEISGINICFAAGLEAGDSISVGDMRIYKDSRIHVDELDEYMSIYDGLNPEAYTEESYEFATEKYLIAYDLFNDPDIATKYDQDTIDEVAKALKDALAALLPMFRAKSEVCSLKGFDVLAEEDLDGINDGGYSFDAAMLVEDPRPNEDVNQSVCVIGGAFEGAPSYGWSCFSTAACNEDGDVTVVKNVFEPEGNMDETAGVRFWIGYSDSYIPRPVSMIVGLGDTTNGAYFECDESSVQVPENDGYIGVAWDAFYDVEGEADIFDCLETIDYITIKIADCAQMEYYLSDLHVFNWSLQAANFKNMDKTIVEAQAYLAGLNRADFTVKSIQRLERSIDAAKELHNTYGVTQEEADEAAALITQNISRLTPIGNSPTQEEIDALDAAYNAALTYWRGNYQASTYAKLKEAMDLVSKYIDDEMSSVECRNYTKMLQDATSGLKPLAFGSQVTSILSFEKMTSRQFSGATGDRRDGIDYALDTKYTRLPSGYAKALKMTATTNCSSVTTDEHGAMQFKLMYRNKGSNDVVNLIPDIENPNIKGDMIGGAIGDLTGTSGLRMWVGINDVNLVEDCTLRIGVSNVTEGPIFERHSTEIPFPATGSGWILVPWEYFEYYDEWTKGQEINLKEIRFYIIRVDGLIKQGLELYVTGISAYKDPTPSANVQPVISNIKNGQEIDVSTGALVPNWDIGSATLNGKHFVYGDSITRNGAYKMAVTNGDKTTTVEFTVVGGQTAYEVPIVVGVENDKTYTDPVSITWDVGEATLNGLPYEKGTEVSEPGNYVLQVTNGDKYVSIRFTIEGETPPEVMKGDFDGDKEITVADALAALRIAAKLVAEDDTSIAIGDVDDDQHVTVADALAILRVAAKLTDTL